MTTIGMLHPGEMGAAIGAVLVQKGHRVLWASERRSAASRERAAVAGLEDVGSAARVSTEAGVVLSICPPASALATAESTGRFSGVYVDANAIAPSTTARVGEIVSRNGAAFVDGGLVGKPPRVPGDVRLYLSGETAAVVSALFDETAVTARVLSSRIGDASALKCGYAAWTKGTIALVLAIRRFAHTAGVQEALVAEWEESIPDLVARYELGAASARAKGWRWVAEMQEIAEAFESAGLPGGFHTAAAAVFSEPVEPADEDVATLRADP